MQINGIHSPHSSTLPNPILNPPNEFNLEEFHALATDPDFKINISHAPKLGVHSFDQARALLATQPLSNASIITLFAIARVHLLWVSGKSSSFLPRLAHELSDERLTLLESASEAIPLEVFRKKAELALECTAALLHDQERAAFNFTASEIAARASNPTEAARKMFELIFSVIAPKWEQSANAELQTNSANFAQIASHNETNHFARLPYEHFAKGQTARWIDRAIESPKEHGLTNSSLSGTHAAYHLQAALLCDVISYEKEICDALLPETLCLDVNHLLRLQKSFNQLVKAQSIVDFYASGMRNECDKQETFKVVYFALQEGDESLGLNLPSLELERLKTLLAQDSNPVVKLHRHRMRELILEGLDKKGIDQIKAEKWRYQAALNNLGILRNHLNRILQVHFLVFIEVYSSLLESHLERTIMTSLLSPDNNLAFRDWLSSDDQVEAFAILTDFRSVIDDIMPGVLLNQRHALIPWLQQWLLGDIDWNQVSTIFTRNTTLEQNERVSALSKRVSEFRNLIRKNRLEQRKTEQQHKVPQQIKTGLRWY